MKKLLIVFLLLICSAGAGFAIANTVMQRGGCCSHHGGVCGCSNGLAVCCDGSYSPSCGCNQCAYYCYFCPSYTRLQLQLTFILKKSTRITGAELTADKQRYGCRMLHEQTVLPVNMQQNLTLPPNGLKQQDNRFTMPLVQVKKPAQF